jgi:5-deoxy-glucuronate isomerase
VFGGVTDFAYVPRDARAQIASGAEGRFALAGAKCERRLPARYGPAPEVPLEERGSGSCARQVRKFALAHAFDCDKLKIYGSNSFGHQRVSPSHEGVTDVLAKVRSGDAVLVPDGWHGPGGSASIRHT